jgi:hypothetical protein
MSLKIRFRFDGKCRMHPRYNPERDGRPEHEDCSGCESLHVIRLYVSIARKKAEAGEGLIISGPEPLAFSDANDTGAHGSDRETEEPDNRPEDEAAQLTD